MSCTDCGCEKPARVNSYFDINDMKVGFVDSSSNNNYSYGFDTSTNGITFLIDSIQIRSSKANLLIYFSGTYFACNLSSSFELIRSAYACDPKQTGQSGSIEPIDSFYIVPASGKFGVDTFYTDTLYTLEHLNYSNYYYHSDTIRINNSNYTRTFNYNSISYLVSRPKLYFELTPYSSLNPFKTSNFEQLRVVLKLKNGERYEKVTKHIKFI